jgi:hypothetical protein
VSLKGLYMHTVAGRMADVSDHPVRVHVEPERGSRNRLTVAFRLFLALPHLILVGAPAAITWTWSQTADGVTRYDWAAGAGALGAVAVACAFIAWFAILFTGRYPEGLRWLVIYFLRWRVRASAYAALLRDEFPPLGAGSYPAQIEVPRNREHNRLTVAFRPILIIPQAIAAWGLGIAWAVTTCIAWFSILFTGNYPEPLYRFGSNVLQWTGRVEAYALLLHDEYPPFSFD